MRLTLILLFVGLFNNLKANNDTIYFDKNWKKCAADTHSFYRLVEIKDNMYHVKDYYGKSHQLQMEGAYSSLDEEIKQGQFYYYYENGNKKSEINYINNKKDGVAKYYFKSGELSYIKNYLDGNLNGDYISLYKNGNKEIEATYVNGKKKSEYIRYYENGTIKRKEIYENDSVISGKIFNKKGKEIKYYPESEMPIYPGGQKQFQKDLMKSIIIPDKFLENGIDKKVIVQFYLNKKGKINNIKFLTQQDKELEEAIIKGLHKTKKWKPAKNEDKEINCQLNIPIQFNVK